ncbi:nicotinate-nucleotide adenylyltransferase [Halobacillus karajensis]|uniref:Probable nicotinate-nucleotide adenylyltransferase n=1 Tax=Halobacillus karajensis TaxID=195088 RepID=A0A024P6K7_9BACI|nr:nicotinate-nucleotide adenylyltransferase [Halobacillus karajensis]CDQ18067.1 putative nicotinate-nucleotide adenylyltransferase [Halobacillus karajensis]CDQ24418.1 putative nicotinate-nucleotide adenylyltransferase [Halobacillus karajensis]CDQ29334.1 putative nicotinate-nucleotide adenylyltransferase [Halobacillus karajensis]SEH59905.1 nicotinate-nucleotide adenylyltransferase [Halobacillus karajensis]
MKKIGILGGTFDPLHQGHLIIGEFALEAVNLDEVWFMPSYIPPHKQESATKPEARLEMVEKAIADHSSFRICDVELRRKGTSYTVDTMAYLNSVYPDHHFYFIIGGDMVEHLPKWNRIEELVKMVDFIGVRRPGYGWTDEIPVHFVDIPSIDVSSTMIRERISKRKSVRYLIPGVVDSFIKEHCLYEDDA